MGRRNNETWWLEKDYLRLGNEKTINCDLTEKDILKMILYDVEHRSINSFIAKFPCLQS